MPRHLLAPLAGAFAVAMTGLLGAHAASAAEPVYAIKPCPADWSTGDRVVECGTLTVDETRGDPNTRRIDIAVARIKARTPFIDASGQALPPVVVFHGGPGGDLVRGVGRTLGFYAANPDRAGPLAAIDQDWIYFDQRGGGLGDPSMDCPDVH